MKIPEQIRQASKPVISLEILPPNKGGSIDSVFKLLDPFMEFRPASINVTYHRAEQVYKRNADGVYQRVEIRKRPGTVGICAAIMNRYGVEAVPHLICGGFSKEETENALIDLNYLGINNILALRGDPEANERSFVPNEKGHTNACGLVRQIDALNNGVYLEEDIVDGVKTNFCVGVAGYPEKHIESPNRETDIERLKAKLDAGAEFVTTQMFFDNRHYYSFLSDCREREITAPIIPGLKPLTSARQLTVVPSVFNVEVPISLSKELSAAKSERACEQAGTEWLIMQCRDLLKMDVPALHFYTLGKPHVVLNVLKQIF